VLGAENHEFVEVKRGLIAGDEVVTRGAYSLAFAGKGSVELEGSAWMLLTAIRTMKTAAK